MSVRVLNPLFFRYTGNRREVEVEGRTVGECIRSLAEQYPEVKKHLFSAAGGLQGNLLVSLNRDVVQHGELDTPVEEGDAIHIMTMIDGG
ncbi:MAG: MoaD/ThiS family protein [Actinobacteria bacterium]|nr:MoaD/ThiS family protein [Actinomycetota bacterium]